MFDTRLPGSRLLRALARAVLGATVLLSPARAAGAQEGGHPGAAAGPSAAIVDSAQAARAAYREAAAAYQKHDLAAAAAAMRRAAGAWPAQPAYLYAAAALSAAAGDTAAAVRWLRRYADLGIGRDLDADTSFAALRGRREIEELAARLRRDAAPLAQSRVAFTIADSTFHPEGVAYDPVSRRWFVGSVRQRRIVVVDAAGSVADLAHWPADSSLAAVFGMAVDSARRLLWAATSALPRMEGYRGEDRGRAGLVAYDLRTGRPARRVWLPADSGEHALGDVLLAPNGDVYTSDSQVAAIYVLRAGSDSLELVTRDPLLRSPQGMVLAERGRALLVADYSHGLLRVDLRTRRVERLATAPGITTVGIDGLYADRGTLVAVQNGFAPNRVVRLCLDAAGRRVVGLRVLDRNTELADEPTLGAVTASGFHYVATSAWEKYDDAGRRVPGTAARAVTVLRVPPGSASCAAAGGRAAR